MVEQVVVNVLHTSLVGKVMTLRISPERLRNQDQEDAIEVSRGPGHAYRMPVRGAVDDKKEVNRQFVIRRTPISLEGSPTTCEGVPY